jgi:hypothetical protein
MVTYGGETRFWLDLVEFGRIWSNSLTGGNGLEDRGALYERDLVAVPYSQYDPVHGAAVAADSEKA